MAQICRLTGGVPLAIELAASWVRILSCREIAQEIERNLDFLAAPMRDVPDRHRSIRVAFDHSWKLLSDEEREILMMLSVFRGGFTREAAEEVAGGHLPVLSMLVGKSLVKRVQAERFDLHELVHQYLARHLQVSGEAEHVRHRHMLFFTTFAKTAQQQFLKGLEIVPWLERLEQDIDNIRAAFDYAIAQQASQLALRLGVAMWRFWFYQGYIAEGLSWLMAALSLPEPESDENSLRARALHDAGVFARLQGNLVQARSLHEESLAIQRKNGDLAGIARALDHLGVVTMFEGRYDLAEKYFQESLQLNHRLGKMDGTAILINNLGILALYQGDYERSQSLHEEALLLYNEMNDRRGMATSLGNLGEVFRYMGNPDKAMEFLDESLTILQEIRDVPNITLTFISMAHAHLAKGEIEHALTAFRSSLQMNRKVGNKMTIAVGLEGIAAMLSMGAEHPVSLEKDFRLSVRLLGAAGQLRKTIGAPRSTAEQAEADRVIAQINDYLPPNYIELELRKGEAMTAEQAVEVALNYLSRNTNVDENGNY